MSFSRSALLPYIPFQESMKQSVQRYQIGDKVTFEGKDYAVSEVCYDNTYWITLKLKSWHEGHKEGDINVSHRKLLPVYTEKFQECKLCHELKIPHSLWRNFCDTCAIENYMRNSKRK